MWGGNYFFPSLSLISFLLFFNFFPSAFLLQAAGTQKKATEPFPSFPPTPSSHYSSIEEMERSSYISAISHHLSLLTLLLFDHYALSLPSSHSVFFLFPHFPLFSCLFTWHICSHTLPLIFFFPTSSLLSVHFTSLAHKPLEQIPLFPCCPPPLHRLLIILKCRLTVRSHEVTEEQ